jgi:6-phospho-beta-glucosidase
MRLTIIGGGGFRVPLVYRALAHSSDTPRLIDEVVLYDVDAIRLAAISNVIAAIAAKVPDGGPAIRIAATLDDAVTGADIVFFAARPGSTEGRVADERIALRLGVLGQETTGAGGVAFALRSIPVAVDLAQRVATLAPDAWVINFTNPAGMVTAAMQSILGDRVIGICDSPIGLVRRAAAAAGVEMSQVTYDYAGLNHLGWLRSLTVNGVDRLPALLADRRALSSFEEGRVFGPELLQLIRCIPNEYLFYYYFTREAIAAISGSENSRGEFIADQQRQLYPKLSSTPDHAYDLWNSARLAREQGYLAEARNPGEERDEADLAGGGYEQVALAVMRSLLTGIPNTLILNVRNAGSLTQLADDALVEIPTIVDADGPHPLPAAPFSNDQLGLVNAMRAVEAATIEAATTGSRSAALLALTVHPLVDSANIAAQLLERYLDVHAHRIVARTTPGR